MESSVSRLCRQEGHESMRIIGEWLTCNDGVPRPVLRTQVQTADGSQVERVLPDRLTANAVAKSDLNSQRSYQVPILRD
jgi:hypothetical protein